MENRDRTWSVVAVILLALILALNIYNVVRTEITRKARAEALEPILTQQMRIADDLITSYQSDAYDNSQVERIAEQQLIATEYQLVALQLVAQQNVQIIGLLADE